MNILVYTLSCLCIALSGLLLNTTFKYYNLKKDLDHEINKYFDLKMKYDQLEVDSLFNKTNNKDLEIISNQIKNTYEVMLKNLKKKFERKSNLKKILENLEKTINNSFFNSAEDLNILTDIYLKLLKEYKEG